MAFFDNRIIDANAPSYSHSSWEATSNRAANAKKKKYRQASEDLHGSFTPLVCSTNGVLHHEYASYQKRLAGCLARKWDKPFSIIMAWVRIRNQFAVFHAVDLRLRGSRRRLTLADRPVDAGWCWGRHRPLRTEFRLFYVEFLGVFQCIVLERESLEGQGPTLCFFALMT